MYKSGGGYSNDCAVKDESRLTDTRQKLVLWGTCISVCENATFFQRNLVISKFPGLRECNIVFRVQCLCSRHSMSKVLCSEYSACFPVIP